MMSDYWHYDSEYIWKAVDIKCKYMHGITPISYKYWYHSNFIFGFCRDHMHTQDIDLHKYVQQISKYILIITNKQNPT